MGEDRNGDGAPAEKAAAPDGAAGGLGSVLYRVALAGVGALILAQEEIEAAWKRARGGEGKPEDDAAGDGQAADEKPAATGDTAGAEKPDGTRVSAQIDGAIQRWLRSLSIPGRAELEAIEARIDALNAKLDARERRK